MADRVEGGDLGPTGGWLVVAVLAACLVGAPLAIWLNPPTFLPYRDAYLALSLVPGLVLGGIGAWLATRG